VAATQYQLNPAPIARRGAAWHWEVHFTDTATGKAFDFTAHPGLTFTTTLTNRSGAVLATLSSNPGAGADGTISGDAYGVLSWDLPIAVVNRLPITKGYTGGTDPRVSVWRNRGLIVLDLVCSDGVNTWQFFDDTLVVAANTHPKS